MYAKTGTIKQLAEMSSLPEKLIQGRQDLKARHCSENVTNPGLDAGPPAVRSKCCVHNSWLWDLPFNSDDAVKL